MDWAQAAEQVSDRWITDGRMSAPPDEPDEDDLEFWNEVEALVKGLPAQESFDSALHPRDFKGRWRDVPGSGLAHELATAFQTPDVAYDALMRGDLAAIQPKDVPALMDKMAADGKVALHKLAVDTLHNLFRRHTRDLTRQQMPVVEPNDMQGFMDFLNEKGVKASIEHHNATDMTATQKELDGAKVARFVKSWTSGERSPETTVLASRDLAVADGHHRWAAKALYGLQHPGDQIGVLRLDANIDEVLALMHEYDRRLGIKSKAFGEENK
jgi:hypothetical protein